MHSFFTKDRSDQPKYIPLSAIKLEPERMTVESLLQALPSELREIVASYDIPSADDPVARLKEWEEWEECEDFNIVSQAFKKSMDRFVNPYLQENPAVKKLYEETECKFTYDEELIQNAIHDILRHD